ncbi:MAG TPA: glycosyltransferase [Ktedonobacterales bacterium]|jgi:chlorobactene glucosyltransferase
MLIYQVVITVILAALLLNTIMNLRLLRAPKASASVDEMDDAPLVSILVPARNEERSIAQCVASLAQQDYPYCEIIVLDDQSEDQTAAIVEDLTRHYPNVWLLHGGELPPNWHGKANACAQLAQAASGEWLLFVDADAVLAPQCVSVTLRQAREQRADLLTMIPTSLVGSIGEALLLPIIPLTFAAFLPLALVMNHPSPIFAGALGQFLLFRRTAYLRIGGHAAVRTHIVEDIQLSRLIKRHGGRLVWIDGTNLMRVQMYHKFAEAWRGITKSAFAAINYSRPILLPGVAACVALFCGPYIFLVVGLVHYPSSGLLFWLPFLQVACLWASYLLVMRRFHLPLTLVFLQAGTALAMILTTLHAAIQTEFGAGIVWKGRTYQFGAPREGYTLAMLWGAGLARARLLIAALLVLSWGTGARPEITAAWLLLAWTTALLEFVARKGTTSRWTIAADLAVGLACLGYLQLSGLLSIWLAVLCVLVIALCVRLFSWQVVATMASALLGSILFITVQMRTPNQILTVWFVLIALAVASHSFFQVIIPWLQRVRSS